MTIDEFLERIEDVPGDIQIKFVDYEDLVSVVFTGEYLLISDKKMEENNDD